MKSVDVVLLTYNSENVIRMSLDSIFDSAYGNFRVIVSDDASQDNTALIVSEYQIRYPGKVVLSVNQKNLGVTANSHRALSSTTADIVMFLGHDDLFYPDKIRACVDIFDNDPGVTLVYHDCDVLVDGVKKFRFSDTHTPKQGAARNYLLFGCFSTAASVCVDGQAARSIGFNLNIRSASDFLLFYEVAKRGGIKYVPRVLGAYCRHGSNLTSAIREKEDFDSIQVSLHILENYQDDRLPAIINLNWTLLKLFSKNMWHFVFFVMSPLVSALWIASLKIGRKRIH